ncbi:glycoside hydrolase family 32 protein [Enterococcus italicus]|uniref:glycoside hydrolase family 32 protein n=1 Tax=Enterococcus italicus TaxID=246144 RepID=UPI002073A225|nr:glycoside hydrolase family 32 protein [Enterococcus italicus]
MIDEVYTVAKANRFIEKHKNRVQPQYREQYHFMAPLGWINDPNGFVYFRGEYHLFYQYYPYDSQWGPMHWGHAKSVDLLHWDHLPVALAPDQWYDKEGCFSGSAIEKDGKLYLMYTGHRIEKELVFQTQCIAVSEDGINFVKLESNPVIDDRLLKGEGIPHDFRDPKVIKHGETFFAIIATKTIDNRGEIVMFQSENLIDWQFYSVLLEGLDGQGIMWECPDLFHLDGKDVLIMSPIQIEKQQFQYYNISSTMACIGRVDWEKGVFRVETSKEIDFGLDFYAPQTLEDSKKQRIMIAWMQMWGRTIPPHELGHGWAGTMTLPRELHVKDGQLIQKPVSLIYGDIEYQYGFENIEVSNYMVIFKKVVHDNTYMHLVADLSESQSFTMEFAKNTKEAIICHYEVEGNLFSISREKVGHEIIGDEKPSLNKRTVEAPLVSNQLILEIFRDTSSLEFFINGVESMTLNFYEIEKGNDLSFNAVGKATIQSFEIGEVKA